jgi:hypothetical protein
MTWVAFRKALYFPSLALAVGGALFALSRYGFVALALAAAVLVVPGLIGRWLLRDLLASRAHLVRGAHVQALEAAQRFLADCDRRPWIRHAIWAQYGTYTLSVEAMALNNTGAALMELQRFADAREMLTRAREADAAYPIPVFNLAVIATLEGDETESERMAGEAARLGFAGGRLDAVMQGVGEAYARLATPR